MSVNLIIAGVGGQGSVLASRVIADAALDGHSGSEVKVRVGETFGAAMRGGAVSSHVRIGDVYSPLVDAGGADLIIALEPLECLRVGATYLKKGGCAILNTVPMPPTDVKIGMATYPELSVIVEKLEGIGGEVIPLNATEIAEKAGNIRSMNIVMLGATFATGKLPIDEDALLKAIRNRVPAKYRDLNIEAFKLGYEAGKEFLSERR